MTPEQRANWAKVADALESGKYKQGNGCLRTKDDRYCCLGVACDILSPDGWNRKEWGWLNREADNVLPDAVEAMLGAGDGGALVTPIDTTRRKAAKQLWELNDDGMPFPEIAKVIREQFVEVSA